MKLSEAMKLGAMLRPQVKHIRHGLDGTCALGAIEDAINDMAAILSTPYSYELPEGYTTAEDEFPFLSEEAIHPVLGYKGEVNGIIADLNNHHGWTRERIADWVATIEPAEEVDTKVVQEEAVCLI